jgi:peptidoglycan/xylan/chitin deacetylase (PgdA/CDA1 family)
MKKNEKIFHFTVDCDWITNSEKALPRLFDIIEKFNIQPTFFLTGKFVEENSEFVNEMVNRKFEIGCHGMKHGLDPDEDFGEHVPYEVQKRNIIKSSEIIQKATGVRPVIFRAPNLHISDVTFRILAELGFKIDSSIPVRRFDFGFGCTNKLRHLLKRNSTFFINDSILEIPPSAFIFPLNMRLLRSFGVKCAVEIVNKIKSKSDFIMFYMHPAEFMPMDEVEFPAVHRSFYKTCGNQNYSLLELFLSKAMHNNYHPGNITSHVKRFYPQIQL